jgi:alpha-tubulin suppressor-like RCC1 family protein
MFKSMILSAALILTGCNELAVFVADSVNKNDGDVTSVDVNDKGYLDIHWYARDNNPSTEYEVYMSTSDQLPESLTSLAIMGDSDANTFTKFTSIKKSWNINPKTTGKLIGTVQGKKEFTYNEKVDSKLYYFFQVMPKKAANVVSTKGGIVRVNLSAPIVSEVETAETGFLFTWPVVEGASEYILYSKSNPTVALFTAPKNQMSVSYEQLSEFQDICIRSKRGELVSDTCSEIKLDIPAAPVASVDLPGLFSTTNPYTVSWTNWPKAKINSHQFKSCSDAKCSENCSAVQETTSTSIVVTEIEGSARYACVQVIDNRGIESAWVSSAKSITVDTVPPVLSLGLDRITRTAIDIDASSSGAVEWKWTVLSGPAGNSGVDFSAANQEDTRATFAVDGVYKLRLTAKDAAGNESHADLKVTMDTTAPAFAGISQMLRKSNTEVMLFWNPASDALSSSLQITYELCVAVSGSNSCLSNFVASHVPGAGVYTYTLSGLNPAVNYEFIARAKDAAGNVNIGSSPVSNNEFSGLSEVVAGDSHNCAIVDPDRSVRCWGKNDKGQLGDGSRRSAVTPVLVPGLTGVSKIALGDNHSCVLLNDGTVKCWGLNDKGQLGLGNTTDQIVPTVVPGLSGIIGIATGASHSCAILATGSGVKCWGLNNYYQMGDGSTTDRLSPVDVGSLTGVLSIKAGGTHTCAIVSPSNNVKCWGRNAAGQLGDTTTVTRSAPVQVSGITGVTSLAVGYDHACVVLSADQKVHCWGFNNNGQIGDNSTTSRPTAVQVNAASLGNATSVYAGFYQTCAVLASDNSVKCWGNNGNGQLGDGTKINALLPVVATGVTNPQSIAVGAGHVCSVSAVDQTIKCWGSNSQGQLGIGAEARYTTPIKPTDVPLIEKFASGEHFNCAIVVSDRSVICWGYNSDGQLGDGTTTNRSTPVTVAGLSGVSSIALGFTHACALFPNGTMKCWGGNMAGAIGDNTNVRKPSPVSVQSLPPVRAIAASDWATCAVVASDDSVMCWGDNSRRAIGDGTNINRFLPTPVAGLSGVDRIYGGTFQHCAIMKSGAGIKCWGQNDNGVLGDGTTTTRSTPVDVVGLIGVKEMNMGVFHSCASMISDGSVYCWGANANGQVGDGTKTDRYLPSKVPGISGAGIVVAGGDHSCAVIGPERKAMCWGANVAGELGDGTYTPSLVPVAVKGFEAIEWMTAARNYTCLSLGIDHGVRCFGSNGSGELGSGARVYQQSTAGENIRIPSL